MKDTILDHAPRRLLVDDEPTTLTIGDAAPRRVASGVRRHALPLVLVASLGLGVLGGTLTPQRVSATTTTAAAQPLDVRPVEPESSRDLDRARMAEQDAAEPTATPTPAASPLPPAPAPAAAPAAPAPAPAPAAPSATGTAYATETLNVRSAPSASADKIASLAQGDKVATTSATKDGFQQVVVDGRAGWASAQYLSKSAPTATPSPSASRGAAAARDGAAPVTTGACAPLPGVRANTEKVHQAICAKFGSGVSSYIGVRPDWDVEHPSGRALDAMVSSNSTGWAIANYVRANASSLGVTEVIFDQKIWTTQRSSEGWRSMSDRGSATANHRDHVHVSTR